MPVRHYTTQSGFLQTLFGLCRCQTKANIHNTLTDTACNTIIKNIVRRKKLFNSNRLLTALGKTSDLVRTERIFCKLKHILQMEMSKSEPLWHKQMANYRGVELLKTVQSN